MKCIVFIFFLTCYGITFGQSVPFERLGNSLAQTNFDLVWSAPTNDLPHAAWIYRALPSKISSDVISNLVALGLFTERDRKNIPENPNLISYADPTRKRSLLINTAWSFIDYKNSDAKDMHIAEGVPDKELAFEIATNWLAKLGIDSSQLAKKTNGERRIVFSEETTIFYKAKGMPAYATNISMCAVTFKRTLDGVEISGGSARGGSDIEIGNHAKIYRILVSWREYERDKLYPIATPKTLLMWIREGKAVWYPSPDSQVTELSFVKKMTITKVTPYYYSDAYGVDDKPYDWAAPFAEMEATIDNGVTNFNVRIDCPIIDETKPSGK